MTNEQKFMEMLNNNEKARAILETFTKYAEYKGLSGKEYQELKKTTVMFAMMQCKELIHDLATEIWEEANA